MILTLEALEAKHGDSLFLHYGETNDPQLIVVDGGPRGVFKKSLRPRLVELKDKRGSNQPLPVRLMMISHIDDDHIKGILELTEELIENSDEPLVDITTLWHNSFDDILGNKEVKTLAAALKNDVSLAANGELSFSRHLFKDEGAAAIAANVPQGRNLRSNAENLGLNINRPFDTEGHKLVLSQDGLEPVDIDGQLSITVIGPSEKRLSNLETDWNKKLPAILQAEGQAASVAAASFMDESVYNLSSIVVLVEAEGKSLLLCGDGLSGDILEGLQQTKRLDADGRLHVDLLKMPHHGSIRNVDETFLRTVTADHYVMSANGKYDNPDLATLELLSEVRGSDEYAVHLTNPVPHAVEFYEKDMKKPGKNYTLQIRDDSSLSLRIDLLEPFED